MPAPGRDTAAYPWANWPMPNPPSTGLPNPQSYDMSTKEGVVIDLVTGLEWQATVDEPKYAWRDAAGYCTGLDLDGGGFRVPSRIELLSIVDYTQPGPVLDARVFPNTPSEPFWTASPLVSDAASAWSVHFGFATTIATASQTMTELHVRCVRGMGGSQ